MMWRLYVETDKGEKIVERTYASAIATCDAIVKAHTYYKEKKEEVMLRMCTPQGHMVIVVSTKDE